MIVGAGREAIRAHREVGVQSLVSLSAFPKSGVTYLSFLLFHGLFPDGADVHDLERKYIIDIHAHPRAAPASVGGMRLFKSHLPYNPAVPIIKATNKAIYLIRHPIDVMMSAWDFENLVGGGNRDGAIAGLPRFRRALHLDRRHGVSRIRFVDGPRALLARPVANSGASRDLPESRRATRPTSSKRSSIFSARKISADRIAHAVERSSMKSMAALEEQEVEKGIEGVFFNKKLSTGYGPGHRFINKGYRNSYDKMLTAEERAKADAMFGSEIARYFAPSP